MSFLDELNNKTRPTEEVQEEKKIKEQQRLESMAEKDLHSIKSQLLTKAENGEYTIEQEQRIITLFYSASPCDVLTTTREECWRTRTRMADRGGFFKKRVQTQDYVGTTIKMYENPNWKTQYYLAKLKSLCLENEIEITTVVKYNNQWYKLPYSTFATSSYDIHRGELYIKCTVKY